ncbi:hypothetical protein TREES_T100021040 [Tupaia chinensis]|uniref:Uncharacterized protein n=1 Tax=Tupaia chinensis TaxID=246437 RepID=L9JEU2_TUPCH|nr:hypothetical protein TREES_T100021040 [Tupaia chinensis]
MPRLEALSLCPGLAVWVSRSRNRVTYGHSCCSDGGDRTRPSDQVGLVGVTQDTPTVQWRCDTEGPASRQAFRRGQRGRCDLEARWCWLRLRAFWSSSRSRPGRHGRERSLLLIGRPHPCSSVPPPRSQRRATELAARRVDVQMWAPVTRPGERLSPPGTSRRSPACAFQGADFVKRVDRLMIYRRSIDDRPTCRLASTSTGLSPRGWGLLATAASLVGLCPVVPAYLAAYECPD